MTATLDELKQALVETLDQRGVLGQVKAKVRAEIFAALDDEHVSRPELPRENALINELIREYLEFNGYHHTLSVLLPEAGHPEERQFDRRFLAAELQVQEDSRSMALPLLYGLVGGLRPHAQEASGAAAASAAPAAASPAAASAAVPGAAPRSAAAPVVVAARAVPVAAGAAVPATAATAVAVAVKAAPPRGAGGVDGAGAAAAAGGAAAGAGAGAAAGTVVFLQGMAANWMLQ
eukprot:TRINITY_DN15211_c0_g1_i1.p1 TRINITY_DN15211_c0_g1~~TRINITY_DN15211_c0_g1_i1.p1  ORF type:complete len:234 (+),score=68.89 TRINITY_DN15211_c0_g1_i1:139-840(+)